MVALPATVLGRGLAWVDRSSTGARNTTLGAQAVKPVASSNEMTMKRCCNMERYCISSNTRLQRHKLNRFEQLLLITLFETIDHHQRLLRCL